VLLRQGKWDEAIEAYQEAVAHPGARLATFHNLAVALERVGRYEEALAALHDAVKGGGQKEARLHTSIGIVSLMMGDVAAADRVLTTAKTMWPSKPSAAWYLYASLTAALLGDLGRALEIVQEGLSHHSRVAALHNNLAALLERRGAYDEALLAAETGLADDPA